MSCCKVNSLQDSFLLSSTNLGDISVLAWGHHLVTCPVACFADLANVKKALFDRNDGVFLAARVLVVAVVVDS